MAQNYVSVIFHCWPQVPKTLKRENINKETTALKRKEGRNPELFIYVAKISFSNGNKDSFPAYTN